MVEDAKKLGEAIAKAKADLKDLRNKVINTAQYQNALKVITERISGEVKSRFPDTKNYFYSPYITCVETYLNKSEYGDYHEFMSCLREKYRNNFDEKNIVRLIFDQIDEILFIQIDIEV